MTDINKPTNDQLTDALATEAKEKMVERIAVLKSQIFRAETEVRNLERILARNVVNNGQ